MLLNPWNRTARFAFVGLALLVLGVGACTTSTTTELEMGQKVTIGLVDKSDTDIAAIDAAVTAFFDTRSDIEGLNINVRDSVADGTVLEIIGWGTHLDQDQLLADLRRAVPALAEADIRAEALTGTLEESFAAKLRREIFQLEIDGATEQEIAAQIMARLAASGQAEGATVDVQMSDGQTEIRITVEEDDTN